MTFQKVQGEFPLRCNLSHLIARIIQIMGWVGYSKHKSGQNCTYMLIGLRRMSVILLLTLKQLCCLLRG